MYRTTLCAVLGCAVGLSVQPVYAMTQTERAELAKERKAEQAAKLSARIEREEAAQSRRKVALGRAIERYCRAEGADLTPRVCLIDPFEQVDIGDLTPVKDTKAKK